MPLPHVDQPLEKGERKRNYLEMIENFDQVDAFDGDLIRAMADKVMVYITKALSSTFVSKKRIHCNPVKNRKTQKSWSQYRGQLLRIKKEKRRLIVFTVYEKNGFFLVYEEF